jgi:hypothetical protein
VPVFVLVIASREVDDLDAALRALNDSAIRSGS